VIGLPIQLTGLKGPAADEARNTGGSDDIGDVSWNVPTVVLRYPANIPGLPGHNWANAISMATPIAHKGVTAGAKVMAMTIVDLLTKPALVEQAWDYFRKEQTKEIKYPPLIGVDDKPVTTLNKKTMAEYREQMRAFYYNPEKYETYLEQLGIAYPTVRGAAAK
jgi:aminobenzoyl-glutamate utilization protein B